MRRGDYPLAALFILLIATGGSGAAQPAETASGCNPACIRTIASPHRGDAHQGGLLHVTLSLDGDIASLQRLQLQLFDTQSDAPLPGSYSERLQPLPGKEPGFTLLLEAGTAPGEYWLRLELVSNDRRVIYYRDPLLSPDDYIRLEIAPAGYRLLTTGLPLHRVVLE